MNYRATDHYIFDHLWSICVEEHFYLMLPVLFIAIQKLKRNSLKDLASLIALVIVLGNASRYLGYKIHFETFNATHNRIDALTWGVLLAILIRSQMFRRYAGKVWIFSAGLALLFSAIAFNQFGDNDFYQKVIFHGVTPVCFFLIILGSYGFSFQFLAPLRWLSYFSYNFYLWHMLLLYWVRDTLGSGLLGLAVFVVTGGALAIAATLLVEERGLLLRKKVLGY